MSKVKRIKCKGSVCMRGENNIYGKPCHLSRKRLWREVRDKLDITGTPFSKTDQVCNKCRLRIEKKQEVYGAAYQNINVRDDENYSEIEVGDNAVPEVSDKPNPRRDETRNINEAVQSEAGQNSPVMMVFTFTLLPYFSIIV